MSTKILGQLQSTSVAGLMRGLKTLALMRPGRASQYTKFDTTHVTINSDSIRLALIEETLSDGSKVYNIELSEACK